MKETILYFSITLSNVTYYKQYSKEFVCMYSGAYMQHFSLRLLFRGKISGFRVCVPTKQFYKKFF